MKQILLDWISQNPQIVNVMIGSVVALILSTLTFAKKWFDSRTALDLVTNSIEKSHAKSAKVEVTEQRRYIPKAVDTIIEASIDRAREV